MHIVPYNSPLQSLKTHISQAVLFDIHFDKNHHKEIHKQIYKALIRLENDIDV